MKIDSIANTRIKNLVDIREGKGDPDLLFVEGLKIVKTAFQARAKLEELYVTEAFLEKHRNEIAEFLLPRIRPVTISDKIAKKLSNTMTPQGIFASIRYPTKGIDALRIHNYHPLVVLDRIQDPGNMGTIIRTADAFGLRNIIVLEGSCHISNQKVIRSSAGSLFHLTIVASNEESFMKWSMKNRVRVFVSDGRSRKSIGDIVLPKRSAVVLGNESSGASPFLKDKADAVFRVPIPGKAESLNVSIAAALIFYDFSCRGKNA